MVQLVKNPPAIWETWVQFLGWEDPLKKGKATHSSILVWRIWWTVLYIGLQRVRHDWTTFTFTFIQVFVMLFFQRVFRFEIFRDKIWKRKMALASLVLLSRKLHSRFRSLQPENVISHLLEVENYLYVTCTFSSCVWKQGHLTVEDVYSVGRVLDFRQPGCDLPDPGIKPRSSTLQADCLLSESPRKPWLLLLLLLL